MNGQREDLRLKKMFWRTFTCPGWITLSTNGFLMLHVVIMLLLYYPSSPLALIS